MSKLSFNRTILELKYRNWDDTEVNGLGFNRTILELK